MLTDPAVNSYYLPKFTPVEERLNGLKQPLVGKGSDGAIYVKSDDDLAGLRIAVRRRRATRATAGSRPRRSSRFAGSRVRASCHSIRLIIFACSFD